ncbi:N-acetylmuramic acid 6-phosphate etherase [Paenibacillus sp. NPDC057967]|uniref:N-acetylmuramic acid 6-phosphate etherase n=1 Tax=Paenibacillus sp. NPDC057967 TaxID=3346293 RepID=UPI0036D920FD
MNEGNRMMITEENNGNTQGLDQMSIGEIIQAMNEEDQKVAVAVRKELPAIEYAIKQIVERMEKGGRLFYIGAGSSGRMGVLDSAECPPTFGVSSNMVNAIIAGGDAALLHAVENAEDDEEAGSSDIRHRITSKDVVVGLAASGRTPYVIGALKEARGLGALTVGVTCNKDTAIGSLADCPIEVFVGPEVITGSTRLKAGTSQKMILNMISTTVMIRLGKVYGNLMVNVKATNAKLRQRVVRIVMKAANVDEQTAKHYSEQAQGDARLAILMIKFGLPKEDLISILQMNNNHFGQAMNELLQQHSE